MGKKAESSVWISALAANLERAVAAGHIRRREDGKYQLVARHGDETAILRSYVSTGASSFPPPCDFLLDFLFNYAHGQSAVPFGCRDCYKVKISATSLRQLMAIKEIADSLPYQSKCGMEPTTPYYAAFFYNLGLDKAREAFGALRQRLVQTPEALYSLIGTTWGGDGRTTFAVPDLRGRIMVGQGPGIGLTPRIITQTGGHETVTLTDGNMPPHTHPLNASLNPATATDPGGNVLAAIPGGSVLYYNTATAGGTTNANFGHNTASR